MGLTLLFTDPFRDLNWNECWLIYKAVNYKKTLILVKRTEDGCC